MPHEEPWYLDSVFYAVDVKRLTDSNGDGIGDSASLNGKIRYLANL